MERETAQGGVHRGPAPGKVGGEGTLVTGRAFRRLLQDLVRRLLPPSCSRGVPPAVRLHTIAHAQAPPPPLYLLL